MILIIEDEEMVARSIKRRLEDIDPRTRVMMAGTVAEGEVILRGDNRIHAVFCDNNIYGQLGYELHRKLARDGLLSSTVWVGMSGEFGDEQNPTEGERYYWACGVTTLCKPGDVSSKEKLRKLLDELPA
jgi:DNA-binding NarL/FixJ family response regulator